MAALVWQCGRFQLDLSRPRVMGIVNVTPDSFSDGGLYQQASAAIHHAERLLHEGADIIDLGAESSRPGAESLSVEEEWARLAPVLTPIVALGKPVSVDTVKPDIMRRALEQGASIINDIQAFRAPGAVEAVAGSDCGLCLMHMQGEPHTMQANPQYVDIVQEVRNFLLQRAQALQQAGIARVRLCLDPGFGFGKRPEHNLALLQATAQLVQDGYPWLVGVSRK
ncbi:MAG: dihydropteroate synthase, partial [Burkholderiales bacterium]